MVNNISPSQWVCTGRSVKGAAHYRSGLDNQDAIEWYPKSGMGVPLILAVSDGHGSAKSFRSDLGSKFAVKTAIKVIQEEFFSSESSGDIAPSSIVKSIRDNKDRVKVRLPEKLAERWKKKVLAHIEEYPFTDREKETLSNKEGEKGLSSIKANPLLVYGATLLVVVITEYFILYLQLGDGDILRVDDKGAATRPWDRNPELIGNETTSLCMDKASAQFQIEIEVQNSYKPKPALILLSTDGYSNSYASDDEFFKVGSNYLQELRESGIESVQQQLEELLTGISSGGSGDDISIGLIFKQPEPENIDSIDPKQMIRQETTEHGSPQSILQETTENGGEFMEVDNKRMPGKTARNNRGMNSKSIAMISLLLAIASSCLSTYLLWKLAKTEETEVSLSKKVDAISTSDVDRQNKINDLEQKIIALEAKQSTLRESKPNTQTTKTELKPKTQTSETESKPKTQTSERGSTVQQGGRKQ